MESKCIRDQKLYDFFRNQIAGLEVLFEKRLSMPVLMLLYATLDIIAFVRTGGDEGESGGRFRAFADKYIVKHLSGITGHDLWGARCAVLHTATPESSSSKRGVAREILYSWARASIKLNNKVIQRSPDPDKYVATSIGDLLVALGDGVDEFLKDLEDDPKLYENCRERIGKFYAHVPVPNNAWKKGISA